MGRRGSCQSQGIFISECPFISPESYIRNMRHSGMSARCLVQKDGDDPLEEVMAIQPDNSALFGNNVLIILSRTLLQGSITEVLQIL